MGILKRIGRLFRGFLSLFVSGVEAENPKALLEAEIQDFNKARADFNENLAKQGGLIRRLQGQIEEEQKKFTILTQRVKALMQAGDNAKAQTLALQRQETQALIKQNTEQLEAAERLFKQLSRQRDTFVDAARKRIEKVKGKISAAEMAEAQAKLTELASNAVFDPTNQGLAGIEERLDERITNAQGKTRVAVEAIEGDAWVVTEAESNALEAAALDDFRREFGMAPPAIDAEFAEVPKPNLLAAPAERIELGMPVTETVKVPAGD